MVRALNYASFRGIKFELETHEDIYKRKIIRHPVALADEEKYEDLGPDEDGFTVRGFLAGDTATYSVDLLRRKLKEDKSGRLIHPYYGIINVRCRECIISENFRFSGKVGLKFNFIEVKGDDDLISAVAGAIAGVQDFIADKVTGPFTDALDLVRMPGYVVASAADIVGNIDAFVRSENGVGVIIDEINSITGSVRSIEGSIQSLINAPKKFAEDLIQAVRAFSRTEPANTLARSLPRPVGTSIGQVNRTLDQIERDNTRAFSDLVQFAAVGRAIDQAREQGPGSDQARRQGLEICEKLTEDPSSDELFSEAYRLRSVLESLPGKGSKQLYIKEPVPSLVLAYEYLSDISRDQEITEANGLMNPLEISGEIYVEA